MIEHNGKYYLNLPSGTIFPTDNQSTINIYVDTVLLQYKITFIHIGKDHISEYQDIHITLLDINNFDKSKIINYIHDDYNKFTNISIGFYYSIVIDNKVDLAKIKMLCNDTNL